MRKSRLLLFIVTCLILSPGASAADVPLIFPIPQNEEMTTAHFTIGNDIVILVPMSARALDISLAQMLTAELSDRYGLAIKMEKRNDIPAGRKVIVLGTLDNVLVKQYCTANKINLTAKDPGHEGYLLRVESNMIMVGGSDDAGAFYGLQSLRQLIMAGKGKTVQGMKVKDWPALPVRAIRLYVPGPDNIVFFKRFMKNFMALYKYNKVVMEFNCMRLDRHPEVNTGWTSFNRYMTYSRSSETLGIHGETKNSTHYDAGDGFILEKEQVRDLVNSAKESFIEVIPEIPSLSHVYYLLANHPELAEYPGDKWPDTYCPSNPDSYKLLFDVYDEYIDVIKPKMVHVGHDEWRGAPIDVCPRCRGKNYSQLYAADVNRIHDYLTRKGIRMAMWGDFLLEEVRGKGPQEKISTTGTKYLLPGAMSPSIVKNSIPKDILIFNWFWDGKENNKDKQVADFGFTQFYGNLEPVINNWTSRIKQYNIAGGGPSSWAATNEYSFGKDLILDFLGCADFLWQGKPIDHHDLTRVVWASIPDIRLGIRNKNLPSEEQNEIAPVDLSGLYNHSKEGSFFNFGVSDLQTGKLANGPVEFNLPSSANKYGIAVGARGTGENVEVNEVKHIPVNEDVTSLIFLQACARPAVNQKSYFNIPDIFDTPDLLGWYEIVYEDGFRAVVPIRYGVNILEWNALRDRDSAVYSSVFSQGSYCYEADAVDCSKEKNNKINAFAFEWVNERLGKVIKEINFHGSDHFQSLTPEYEQPVTTPMPANAVLLLALSKVKKRERIQPY